MLLRRRKLVQSLCGRASILGSYASKQERYFAGASNCQICFTRGGHLYDITAFAIAVPAVNCLFVCLFVWLVSPGLLVLAIGGQMCTNRSAADCAKLIAVSGSAGGGVGGGSGSEVVAIEVAVARDPVGFAAVGKKVTSIGSAPISRTYDLPHSFAEDGVFTRVGISTFDQNFGVAFKSAWRGKLFLGCFVTRVSAPECLLCRHSNGSSSLGKMY
jgi:hypothetical protein